MPPSTRRQVPPVPSALIRDNPVNGRKAFYVGSARVRDRGACPPPEARALLRELREAATRPEIVYRHRWQVGIW